MPRLLTFGGLALEAATTGGTGVRLPPRRLALLAVLAAAGERGVSRDKLLMYFWPESDTASARHALAQALHALRHDTGLPDLIQGREQLRLNGAALTSDVADFAAALRAGEPERAAALYAGPFLDGIHVDEAPEFERWTEQERARLAAVYLEAVESLARRATAAADHARAAEWLRRALAADPPNSRLALALMRALEAAGDRANALLVATAHEELLREDLRVNPPAELLAYAEMLRQLPRPQGIAPLSTRLPAYHRDPLDRPVPRRSSRVGLRLRWPVTAVSIAVIGAAGLVAWPRWLHPSTTRLDPNRVAVLPFHVVGDSGLRYLHEGILDLMAAKLTGDGGPHAVDPQSVMRAWSRTGGANAADVPWNAAVALAQRLGAGLALVGDVVGSHDHLIINAALLSAPGGEARGAATVTGPVDSLPRLIDRLTAQILARAGDEDEPDLRSLTSTSLPALRAYLDGKAAYRRGRYGDAAAQFRKALFEDTTFALAALGLRYATGWTGLAPETAPAWRLRARLNARDRIILTGIAGPHFPAPSSEREFLTAWESAVIAAPDLPEPWYQLGDALYHAGATLDEDPSHARATAAFRRAVQLDSGFAAPLAHLVELAARAADTSTVRRLGTLYLVVDSAGDFADYIRWRVATTLDDHRALTAFRASLPALGGEALRRIVIATQLDGIRIDDAERASRVWSTWSDQRSERWLRLLRLHDFALNRGAPHEALRWTDSLHAVWPRRHAYLRLRISDALYGQGDTGAAQQAASQLALTATTRSSESPEQSPEVYADLCSLAQWQVLHGHTRPASRALLRLLDSATELDSTDIGLHLHWCAIVVRTLALVNTHQHPLAGDLHVLDSLAFTGPRPLEVLVNGFFDSFVYGNLLLSRLHQAAGDLNGALDLARRRPYQAAGATYLAAYLLQEARLCALVGDSTGGRRAYRHYLVLRSHPEPDLASELRRVDTELSKIDGRGR